MRIEDIDTEKSHAFDTIVCKNLVLQSPNGEIIGILCADDQGNAQFSLGDSEGEPHLLFIITDGVPRFIIQSENEDFVTIAGTNELGGVVTISKNGQAKKNLISKGVLDADDE